MSAHGVFYQKYVNPYYTARVEADKYNSTPKDFFKLGKVPTADPLKVDQELIKFGIQSKVQS